MRKEIGEEKRKEIRSWRNRHEEDKERKKEEELKEAGEKKKGIKKKEKEREKRIHMPWYHSVFMLSKQAIMYC